MPASGTTQPTQAVKEKGTIDAEMGYKLGLFARLAIFIFLVVVVAAVEIANKEKPKLSYEEADKEATKAVNEQKYIDLDKEEKEAALWVAEQWHKLNERNKNK